MTSHPRFKLPTSRAVLVRALRTGGRRSLVATVAGVVFLLVATATGPNQTAASPVDGQPGSETDSAVGLVNVASVQAQSRPARRWPPTPKSVGVPRGTALKTYRGPCTITRSRIVIEKKVINCSPLYIEAVGVVIRKSKINGGVRVGVQDDYDP